MSYFRPLLYSLLLIAFTACSENKDPPEWTPLINPHPQHFLTLHGVIAPPLQKEIHLRFIQIYVGSSSKCTEEGDPLSGIPVNPSRDVVFLAHPNPQNGQYEVKIPLDYYLPGLCNWISGGLNYALTDLDYQWVKEGFGFVNYDNQHSEQYNPIYYNFFCRPGFVKGPDDLDDCRFSIPDNTSMIVYFKNNRSATQEFNVLVETGVHS